MTAMTTAAPPQVNGHPRPLPVVGDWRPIQTTGNATVWEKPTPESDETPAKQAPTVDHVALAEAEAIRERAAAEAEAVRTAAAAEAKGVEIKAEEDARKLRLINDRAERRAKEDDAASEARIAESKRKKDEADRLARQARKTEEAEQHADDKAAKEVANADAKWRTYAIRFAIVCGIVALPVQIAAFWNPAAWWLVAAPVMLEGGSWVVQRGAASAVANRRPLWHYRTIAWLLAFVAAGINLWHGWTAFDPATAIATAFASVAGPGVWDLHEHGRIRKRDRVLSRKERRAKKKAAEKAAKEKAAIEAAEEAEKEAVAEAAAKAAAQLASDRERDYPGEWEYAKRLASAMGATSVTDAVWDRAWDDLHAAKPGVTVNTVSTRNVAAIRMVRALEKAPENTPSKVTNAQRVPHLPTGAGRGSKTGPKVRGIRRQGDAPKFVSAARAQAAITAKKSVQSDIRDAV